MIFISPATAGRSVIVPIFRCSASGHTWFIDSPLNCALPLHTFILCSGTGASLLCTLFWTRCFPLHTSAESYATWHIWVTSMGNVHKCIILTFPDPPCQPGQIFLVQNGLYMCPTYSTTCFMLNSHLWGVL